MSVNALTSINSTDFKRFASLESAKETQVPSSIYGVNNVSSVGTGTELTLEKTTGEDMKFIAHRGYTKFAPENTIPAFIAAAQNGFSSVECDIQWTKDSVPVILHDSTINRTARHKNGWGLVFQKKCSDLNYEDLLNFDFGISRGGAYKGTKIPTFSEFISCCSEYDLKPYIELKQASGFSKENAQKLVDIVKEAGLEDKVTWISFNADYLKTMSELMPNVRLGYLSSAQPTDKTIETLQSLKTEHNEVFLDAALGTIDKKSSEKLKEAGFSFEVWTSGDGYDLDILRSYDCKGFTTNGLPEGFAQ